MRRRFLNNINKSISGGNDSEYFTIEALEDGLTAKLSNNACKYRIDYGSWNTLSTGSSTVGINKGQTLSFKGSLTPNSSSGIGTFTISKKCNLKGNIMSMLYGDNFVDKNDLTGKNYTFYKLFYDCKTIVDASELLLPVTTLANGCYNRMFAFCTSLTNAPKLPATTLASSCYSYMFEACSSLTNAPELPVTTLASSCYSYMFYKCTSLTSAPELPATTLADRCYYGMFYDTNVLPDCNNIDFTNKSVVERGGLRGLFAGTKVTDADLERILPKNNEGKYCLPVTTLANYCYKDMFQDCSSLTTAPELPATTLANYCYEDMFRGCSSLTTAPELPATTLASGCYGVMFYNCSDLTTAPELPATTLASGCYEFMFTYCNNLIYIKMLATDISASYCLNNWVNGVASTGTFVKHPDMTSLPSGSSGIPNGWTVEDYNESNLITFTIIDIECYAEYGMTWADWYVSNYNNVLGDYINPPKDSIYENLDTYVTSDIGVLCDEYGNSVHFGDVIIKNHIYKSNTMPD